MIQGHGRQNAEVMLIGDGASNEDVANGYAITGSNEVVLKQLGLKIAETYRTLFIKEKVNLQDYKSYEEKATGQYQELLKYEISQINPNIIIPMGEVSFRYLTGLRNIRKYRGSVLGSNIIDPNKTIKILPILGPQPYLQQEYQQRFVARADIDKINRYKHDEAIPDTKLNIWICRNPTALRNFLERSYKPDGKLVFDIETYLGIPTCISLCFDGKESCCVPFLDDEIDLDTRMLMMHLVAKLLASPIRKKNQNITYDARILNRFHYWVENIAGDTAIGAAVLYPELPRDLGFLTSIWTELPYHKDEGKEYDVTKMGKNRKEQFYFYCCKDSLATWLIDEEQQNEIDESGQRYVYDSLCKLIPLYKRMEDRGLRIDDTRRRILLSKYWNLYDIHTLMLRKLVNEQYINPMSSQQMNRLVFETLGYKKTKYASDTGEESLEWLMVFGETKSPATGPQVLREIILCRKIHKCIEILEIDVYPDGRLRCTYNLGGTETGRTKSGRNETEQLLVIEQKKKGLKFETVTLGHSFQNIGKHGFRIHGEEYGKDIRSIFVPSPGYSFVEVDLSQAEARVDAVLAGNYEILRVFDGPIGIHRLTGSWVYNCDPSTIKKNTLEYLISKQVRHAGERAMGPERLVLLSQSVIGLNEAKRVLKVFHENQPEIRDVYHRDVREAVEATGMLEAPNGRRRIFMDRPGYQRDNEAISQLPQCIVSDQVKFSLVATFNEVGGFAHLINEAHDGTLAEVKHGREMDYIACYKRNVETPIDFRNGSLKRDFMLTIPSEASIGDNWYYMEDVR